MSARVVYPRRSLVALIAAAMLIAGWLVGVQDARADGDPGSDVLVYQSLFVGADAGFSVAEQAQLSDLLAAAARAGAPIRVAVIAGPGDLGSVTALWRAPRSYARFLGIELSLAYRGRLLVVMPNGFGFNWPGHATAAADRLLARAPVSSRSLASSSVAAVRALAASAGVRLRRSSPAAGGAPSTAAPGRSAAAPVSSSPGRSTDTTVAIVVLTLLAGAAGAFVMRRRLASFAEAIKAGRARGVTLALPGLAAVVLVLLLAGGSRTAPSQAEDLASNPSLDPGTPLSIAAPDFALSDQFGQRVSLRSLRGKVVVLAFTDAECTTVCPLTTQAMLDAKAMLGPAADQVRLLGIDANPASISIQDVMSYSQLHGMTDAWHFLTGTLPQLERVWAAYHVESAIDHGEVTHTPALFVIDPQGRERKVYVTQASYGAIPQFGQVLAHEIASLLPSRPAVHSSLSYARITGIPPTQTATLPTSDGGSVAIGPGAPRLFVFFATWDRAVTSLAGQLDGLSAYEARAKAEHLPPLTAVDEGSVEPSAQALPAFTQALPRPLRFPVAIDQTGRIADGYGVQGAPWFVLTSSTGRILWYSQVSTAGWPSTQHLIDEVRAALARSPTTPTTTAATARALSGSPAPLAALHDQASRVLGSQTALDARIRALHGYPIVINAWASWCTPCRAEFALFASAAARYGRRVAFLGANTDDSSSDAASFLAQHPVSYPSYETTTTSLRSLAVIAGLPTTVFIDSTGKVVYVHTGQYDSQGTLDADIAQYAR